MILATAVETRLEFARYGETSLLAFHNIMSMSDQDFFDKYKTHKRHFIQKIADLDAAVKQRDYVRRNELYDYFIEVL
jgi:hypothetical protein